MYTYFTLQKGTVVEKLEEETVKDNKHLRYLIGICEGTEKKILLMVIQIDPYFICSFLCNFQLKGKSERLH